MFVIGDSLQGFVDNISGFFGVFREILEAFPFPIIDHFWNIIVLLLAFAVAKIIQQFI